MNERLSDCEFRGWWVRVGCALTGVVFIAAGVNHFVHPGFYERIIPPGFPMPGVLVWLSGVFEILGGIGLLVGVGRGLWCARLRRAAGWGLIALLVAVFPANVYMAMAPERFADLGAPVWALGARLPLQAVILGWVWLVALRRGRRSAGTGEPITHPGGG